MQWQQSRPLCVGCFVDALLPLTASSDALPSLHAGIVALVTEAQGRRSSSSSNDNEEA